MRRATAVWVAVLATALPGLSGSAGGTTGSPVGGTAVAALLAESGAPARFKGRKLAMKVEPLELSVNRPQGRALLDLQVIRDGTNPIALLNPEEQWLELLAFAPDQAPAEIRTAPSAGHAGLFGPRLSLSLGVPEDETGGSRDFNLLPHEGRLVLLLRQEWPTRQRLAVSYYLEPRLDERQGYVWDVAVQVVTTALSAPERLLSFAALSAPGGGEVWPSSALADRTAYTPTIIPGWHSWWNNAGSAAVMPAADAFLNVRKAGAIALIGGSGWAPVLSYSEMGPLEVHQRTGPLWHEQQAFVRLPAKDPMDASKTVAFRCHFGGLPPEAADRLRKSASVAKLEGRRSLLLRLGVPEGFEDQPLAVGEPVRGVPAPSLTVTQSRAHSGKRCVATVGRRRGRRLPADAGRMGRLIRLEPGAAYRLEAWVQVVGADGEAYLLADRYSGEAPDGMAAGSLLGRLRTPSVRAGNWQQVVLDLPAAESGAYLDLRFIALGTATGYLDDFQLRRL